MRVGRSSLRYQRSDPIAIFPQRLSFRFASVYMMATPCRRGIKRAVGVNADGPIKNHPDTPAAIDDADCRSSVCAKGLVISPRFEILREKNLRQRRSSSRHFLYTCTILATLTLYAGAFHDAAFVTRTGHGKFLMQSTKNRGCSYSSVALSSPCGSSGSSYLSRSKLFDFNHGPFMSSISARLSSLRMAKSSEVELQSQNTQSDVEDEDEWRTVVAAFQMYKAAYGDLKVPSRFIVPGMAPWPEPAWKMKLGQRVASIRSTGKYVQNNEIRRKILDDMGFLWRLRSPSPGKKLDGIAFEQVYAALKMFRDQVQPGGKKLDVPLNFVVPDFDPWPDSTRGLPLGKIMQTVRTKAYLKQHPDAEDKLMSLGFQPDIKTAANDLRYQRVYDALVVYKELYGDLLVPQPFTVPEDGDEWPEEVHGLHLGARVNAIRTQGTFVKSNPSRKDELDELGFVWDLPSNEEGKRRGRKRKGDFMDEFDDDLDGTEDGEETSDAETIVESKELKSLFDSSLDPFFTGDQSNPPQWAFEGDDDDDDTLIEQQKDDFKYTEKKSFNETLEEMAEMAMSIGIMERWTPTKRVVKGAREKYVPWRNDDFGGDFVFEDVVEALILYKELYGNFDTIEEDEYVVPEPVEESLRLSPFELAAMNDDFPDDLDDFNGPNRSNGKQLLSAIKATDDWPEQLAGMKLGQIVSRIREGGLEVKHLPERKAQLDKIGFDWGDPKRFVDVPFEKVMCALYAYFMIRGDTFVKTSFVIPDEHPWPTILAGFELGSAVVRLRQLQNFLEAYHPVKMSLLRMVDFSFFPEIALPLDPDADEMNAEHLYVETFGHPLYHISTVPLGLPERMLADGPNGPPEKLSSWYNYEYVREFHERPGALTDVADWMRDIGFYQLAEEHEQKYGQSHYRQLFLLKEKLDSKEISQEVWDQEIDRIKDEVMEEFENWKLAEGTNQQLLGDGEFDYTINEDDYYYQALGIASNNAQDSSQFQRPIVPSPTLVNGESLAEFSLGGESGN